MLRNGMKRPSPLQSLRKKLVAGFGLTHSWRLASALAAALSSLAVASSSFAEIVKQGDPVAKILNDWFAEGSAAGLTGMVYENRDDAHSMFDYPSYPQLEFFHPGPDESPRMPTKGASVTVRPMPTFANASMSAPAAQGGSLPRLSYYLDQNGLNFLSAQYLHNNLSFYPEHQDHDEGFNGRGGWGDLYPTNSPCLLISQGSSFSDKPFLQAFIRATAALKPETQSALIRTRLLVPALQSLFRQTYGAVRTEEDYFTGKAHPVVFDGTLIDEERFVRRAHGLTVPAIPPIVLLEVLKETQPQSQVDFFEENKGVSERIADSPCVIARTFRGSAFQREMIVTARKTGDLMGRLLEFKWVLLQGDPNRVTIKPSPTGEEAHISVAWHPMMWPKDNIHSHRVDIGVFASNGVSWSPPSFITFYMLPNEARFYTPAGRLEEICYAEENPDPGLPELTDLRWLSFARKISGTEKGPGLALVRQGLPKKALSALKALADDMAAPQAAWRKLDADKEQKPAAEAALNLLKDKLAKRLKLPVTEGAEPLWQTVEKAVVTAASDPNLLDVLQGQLPKLITSSSKPNATAEILAMGSRLTALKVLEEPERGRFSLRYSAEKMSQGERHLVQSFNLALLSEALLPDFLERRNETAFVDRRLTIPKPWRDVYRYNKKGECTGWTRIADGKEVEFDAEGKLLPQGRSGAAVPVRYVRDPASGALKFEPN